MYLVTEDMEEVADHRAATGLELPMALDFAGEIYIRQEGGGMLLGTYEQACVPWQPQQAPWSFDMELLEPDLDRIAPSLEIAFKHYPAMATAGIKRIINGPFTFAPDGNPLVGPIRGVRNCWVACAVMAGLSQGGGVGLALANWMTTGDPQLDIWAMDVARFGDWATLGYTNAKVRENYSRRFRITFPNEELPAGRPLHTTPVYDRLTEHNAVWGAGFGLEHPLWFQRPGLEPVEDVTFRRSNAFPVVGEECRAVRERVGLTECSNFAKYRVTGDGAAAWLQGLFTNRLPKVGRIALDRHAEPRRADRRRVLRGPHGRRRVLPVRLADRRGPPLPVVPRSPPARLTDPVRRARVVAGGLVARRPARSRRPPVGDADLAGDHRLPVHDVPADRHRDGLRRGSGG